MKKFIVTMQFEIEADTVGEAEDIFWSWDDQEFIEKAQEVNPAFQEITDA